MRRLHAAAKLAGLGVLLFAPPLVLWVVADNPLPPWPIDWGLVSDALLTGAVATSTWLKAVAVVGWMAWTFLVLAVAVDLVAALRGQASRVRLAPVQALVATIVSLAGQVGAGGDWTAAVVPAPATAQVAAVSYDATDHLGERIPDGMHLVEVAEGDSWAGLAQTVVGDPSAASTIRDANVGRDVGGRVLTGDEAFVEAGWQLLVPTGDPVATDQVAKPVHDQVATLPDVVVVAAGDSFWTIAEDVLETNGEAPTDAETAIYWGDLVEANLDRLEPPGDPDRIYPGQRFVLPPLDADAPPASAPTPSHPPAELMPDETGDGDPVDSAETSTPDVAGEVDGDLVEREALDRPADGWRAAVDDPTSEPDSQVVVQDDLDADDRNAWGIPRGLPAGLAGSALLAAGVATLLKRRRRAALEQRPQGLRLPTPAPDVSAQVSRLEVAAPPEEALDDLVMLLSSIPEGVLTPLVTVTDEGEVTLLFAEDAPVPEPPSPWQLADLAADAPVGWTARFGDRGPMRSIGLPLLTTLGRTGTRTVLADLGSMGALAVVGDDMEVRQRLRAFSLEVGTSRTAGPLEVVVVGDELLESVEQIRLVDDPTAELASAAEERDAGVIDEDRVPRLVVCHPGVTVPEVPGGLDGFVAVVASADLPNLRWTMQVSGDVGQLRFPDGGRVELTLPEVDPELVDAELRRTDLERAVPIEDDAREDAPVVVTMPTVDQPRFVEIRLLGQVELVREGQPVEGLTRKTLELLAYLATHRHGVTREQMEDAVWDGKAAKPGSQRVKAAMAKARDALGVGPDGELLVPRRRSATSRPELSEHVGTDLDRAFARLTAARQLPESLRYRELSAALELARGTPFAGLAVSWASDVAERAITELQEAALEAASYWRESGEWDAAKGAIERGLLLCDPSEVLYLEWARLEVARGRRDQVGRIWKQLRDRYADDADDITATMTIPTAETELQFQQLLAGAGV